MLVRPMLTMEVWRGPYDLAHTINEQHQSVTNGDKVWNVLLIAQIYLREI